MGVKMVLLNYSVAYDVKVTMCHSLFTAGLSIFFLSLVSAQGGGWAEMFCLQFLPLLFPTLLQVWWLRARASRVSLFFLNLFQLPFNYPVLNLGVCSSPGVKGIRCCEPSLRVLTILLTTCARNSDLFSSGVIDDLLFARNEGQRLH